MRGIAGLLLLGCAVLADRDGRWFSRETRTVTKVVKQRQLVTESTPSSCVVVQTMLPPCRHLRAVSIQPTQTQRIMETKPPTLNTPENQGWKPLLQPSDPVPPLPVKKSPKPTPPMQSPSSSGWSWDNIFNLGPKEVVVTQTIRELYTTKYMDPNTVVTFSVKGCRPSRLPFDLPECEPPRALPPPPEAPESGVIVMAPIQFVQGMAPMKMTPIQPQPPVQQVKPVDAVKIPPTKDKNVEDPVAEESEKEKKEEAKKNE